MPQPLSALISSDVKIFARLDDVLKRQELAAMAFASINSMSNLDGAMGSLVGTLSPGKAKPVIDYFLDLRADGPKSAMIHALARSQLQPDRLRLFNAIWKGYETIQKRRNPIAHGLWGYCYELPDALICLDPRYLLKVDAKRDVIRAAADDAKKADKHLEYETLMAVHDELFKDYQSEAQVYRAKDFQDLMRDTEESVLAVIRIARVIRFDRSEPAKGQRIYELLVQRLEFQSPA